MKKRGTERRNPKPSPSQLRVSTSLSVPSVEQVALLWSGCTTSWQGAKRESALFRQFPVTPRSGHPDDDLAEMGPRLQVAEGLARLLEGEGAIDHGPQAVQLDGPVHVLEHGPRA